MALRTIRTEGDSVLEKICTDKKTPASRQNDTEDRGTDHRYAGYHV